MGYKEFIKICKDGMKLYEYKDGSLVCSLRFFEFDTYEALRFSKFFDKKRRLKKFLNEVYK